jgi:multidrug efflux system outer membrane protein
LDIAIATVALRDSTLQIIEERFEKGIIPEIDLNQAQIQLAIAESEAPVWKRLSAQTELQIKLLAGEIPGQVASPRSLEDLLQGPVNLPSDLPLSILGRRPDVLAAEQELIAQNALVGAAQANRLPNISLSALLGGVGSDLSSLSSNGLAWNMGGSILGPVFFFNRFKRLADIEKSRREQAQLNYELTVLNALQEVKSSLVAVEALSEELEARRAHFKAALNAEKLSKARYLEGVTRYLEFLESQRQAFQAQQNLAATQQQGAKCFCPTISGLRRRLEFVKLNHNQRKVLH